MSDKNGNKIFKELGIEISKLRSITEYVSGAKEWDLTHRDLLNLDIVILGKSEITTSYGDALLADVVVGNERKTALIGSIVLCRQLNELADQFPVAARIIKRGRYYTFVDPVASPFSADEPF